MTKDLDDKASKMYTNRNSTKGTEKDVETSTMWGFGCGFIGIFLVGIPILNIILGLASTILGIIGLTNIKKMKDKKGFGFAIFAIIVGIIEIIIGLVMTLGLILFL
ncbi:hypothetical protein K9L97_00415 [Candidatus Woesearchaeota archaeon]|nr:hypothetical protein [Candidatus Woesearchaeota archaeon]